MAVNLSPIWGAGAQLFDNSGNVLTGGKIYTYAAGTTTPAATYTSSNGIAANSNPIILNSAGRVPYEIWLTDAVVYKFVLKDSNDVLIATYDNLVGINSNFIAYTMQQEIQTATAGQTVFNLTTMQYQPGTHNLSVFVDGVNQYGPGAQYAYVETDTDTVTFVNGLHVGASVKFTTASPISSSSTNAENVAYDPPFTGAVGTNVELKLAQTVSVKDFGAVGDGVTDDSSAIQDAVDYVASLSGSKQLYFPSGTYNIESTITIPNCSNLILDAEAASFIGIAGTNDGFIITDGQWNHYKFGTFTSNTTGACIFLQPTSIGGQAHSTYSWRSMVGTGGHKGFGFRIRCEGASNNGVSVGRIIGAYTKGFDVGVSFETSNALGGVHNIDTMQVNLNYVFDNNISINVGKESGATINANTWLINYEASITGSIGFKTNGEYDVIYGTVYAVSGATLNQLDAGALSNQFHLIPAVRNDQGGTYTFPGSTWVVDNSGNNTNSGLSGYRNGSSCSYTKNVVQTIPNATWTKVAYQLKEWDDYELFDNINYKWAPGYKGRGRITAQISWGSALVDGALYEIAVYKNGSVYKTTGLTASGTGTELSCLISCDVYLNATTDYFEIYTRQSSGLNADIHALANLTFAQFEITRG